jgi:hypothetical protein
MLEIEERDGVIELRPAASDVTIVQTPEGPVAAPLEDVAPLSTELVRDVVEQVRR